MRFRFLLSALTVLALVAAACGDDDADESGAGDDDTAAEQPEPADDAGAEGSGDTEPSPEGPIKIGVIADLTGPFTTYGTSLSNSVTLAVDEINASGGIDGRQVELLVEDIQTDVSVTVDKARKLLESDGVDLIVGPIGSDANDAAFQTVAVDGGTLLFYPETYEGGKCHENFFGFGAVPAQQVRPLIPILQDEFGPKVLLFGADIVWANRTFEIARPLIEEGGGEVVDELLLPLVADDFSELVVSVRNNEPDYILSLYPAVWGPALKALDDAGLLDDVGIGTTFLGEPDLAGIGGLAAGDYTALPFFTSVEGEGIDLFVAAYQDSFGADAIPSGGEAVGAYNSIYMYKAAVESAGTTDTAAVSEALVGSSFTGPTGEVTITESHHLRQPINLVIADETGSYTFVETFLDQDPEEDCSL